MLSHPDRVRIITLLAGGGCVSQRDLLEEVHWPYATLARHVAALRARGLIVTTRRGADVFLELADDLPARLLVAAGAPVGAERRRFAGWT